jgi:Pro-kumamolisin, activation domain
VSASATQTAEVVLRPRDGAALTSLIAAVTDARSPLFHHYLPPGAFASRFGPAPSTIAMVTSQLQADGLQVTGMSDGMVIDVRASASQVGRAFGTGLEQVKMANGSIGRATTGAVRLPSSIAGSLAAVVGLNGVVRASVDVYEGPSPSADGVIYDPVDPYVAIVGADRDQVVSTSWGLCEQAIQLGQPGLQAAENVLFEQAAAQGQSIFAASGDNGSDDCNTFETNSPVSGQNPVSVDDPGSQPYVVSAGGTTIDDATQPPLEHVWNDGADGGGGGGGISMSWAMPSWQAAARVPGIVRPGAGYAQANAVEKQFGYPQNFCQAYLSGATSATPCRTVPDVSAQADEYTGAITVYSSSFEGPGTPDGWTTIGGTSSAAPLWAAMLALVNASPACATNATTRAGVGFVSPLLYAVASNPAAYRASFTDITTSSNDIYGLDDGQVFPATPGYDLGSGLGSPQLTAPGDKAGLAFYLCSYGGTASRPAVTKLTPAVLPTAGGTVQITGSGFTTASGADVAGIQVGGWPVAADKFTVNSNTSITATFPPAADTVPPNAPRPQDGAGPASVIVTSRAGASSVPGPNSTIEYVDTVGTSAVPSITGVIPYGGSESAPGKVIILGSGFTGATAVTFGGVAASGVTVDSPYRIAVTPPAYSARTACSPLPSGGVYSGEDARNDICQVQVRVSNRHGSSAVGRILPPLEGAIVLDAMGVLVAPLGCGCETAPAPTEYDYAPAPSITSVSTTTADPGSLASEGGGTLITVTGQGFNPLTIEWADFGPPALESSMDTDFAYLSGTQMQIAAPGEPLSTEPVAVRFSVRSLAGQSPGSSVTYAGVPQVTAALNTATGKNGAADTGGAPMAITGHGFDQAVGPLQFVDTSTQALATQYTYTARTDSRISTESVASNPGLDDVEVCSVTACSLNPPADYFYLYPPGNPKVTPSCWTNSSPISADRPARVQAGDLLGQVALLLEVGGRSGCGLVRLDGGSTVASQLEEVSADGVEATVGVDPGIGPKTLNQFEAGPRPGDYAEGDGVVERDDRAVV